MKFFVKDFCKTVQARVVIFGMQVDNEVLYRGIVNQPSPAYSSLYLSDFLSFHTLNDEIFVKEFSETVQARVFIFGIPRFEKVGGILVYICPSFHPSFRPSVRPSVIP